MDRVVSEAHHLILRRDIAEMSRVNRFVEDAARLSGWPAALIFPLQLCLEEAVSNVIRHGVLRAGADEICVLLGEQDGSVVACVEDEGEAFDPTAFTPPPCAPSLAETPPAGKGIHLMRNFARRIAYAGIGPRKR